VFGSVIAAEAVAAVWDLECVLPNQNPEDSDYEDYIGNQGEGGGREDQIQAHAAPARR